MKLKVMKPSSCMSIVRSRASPKKEENKGNDCFYRMLGSKRGFGTQLHIRDSKEYLRISG